MDVCISLFVCICVAGDLVSVYLRRRDVYSSVMQAQWKHRNLPHTRNG